MSLIYIIEDDEALRRELQGLLACRGFDVVENCAQGSAKEIATDTVASGADCAILDLTLPCANGHDVCREIRNLSDIPIIMLTSSVQEIDEVLSLGFGADDYVTKPYSPASLIARIEAILRRKSNSIGSMLSRKGVSVDIGAALVRYGDNSAELTRNELKILQTLMENPGKVISRIELMERLWETDEFVDDNTLTVNINRLRKKLLSIGIDDGFIKTRRNLGYVI